MQIFALTRGTKAALLWVHMKTNNRTLILTVLTLLQLGTPSAFAGGDRLSEAWQSKHSPTGEDCRLQHRELEFSYPELFVSIPTSSSERERDAFAGLAQVQGMSYSEFRDLLFGEGERKWSGNKGLFNYEAIATGSAKSGTRKITFSGQSDTDRGQTKSGRKVVLNIQVTGDRISLNVTQMRKGFFGWKTVYQGSCTGLKKIALSPQESEESLDEQNGAELTTISQIRFKAPRQSATRSRSATGNNKPSSSIAAL